MYPKVKRPPENYTESIGFNPATSDDPLVRFAFSSYRNQKNRCLNRNVRSYSSYGAIGISVEYNFQEFLSWCKKNIGKSLLRAGAAVGRINHSKNYSLENIEAVTKSENSRERISRAGVPIPKVPIVAIKKSTGEVVGRFDSLLSAAASTGLRLGSIHRWAKSGKGPKKNDLRFEVAR